MTATHPVLCCIVCGAPVPRGKGRRYRLPARRRFAVCRGRCRQRFDLVIGAAPARIDAAREAGMRARLAMLKQPALPGTVTRKDANRQTLFDTSQSNGAKEKTNVCSIKHGAADE